jgi:hypothetical protein
MRRSVWVVFAVGSIAALVVPFGCNDNEVEPETDFTISGTVTSVESGDPIEGVVVFVMERTTDTRSVAETNSDGEFALSVDQGAYDIGYLADDYVTEYYGPIVADGQVQVDESLESSAGMDASRLYGKVIDTDGEPVSGWTVRMFSSVADSGETASTETVTDAAGEFELTVNGEVLFDLDFVSPAADTEFVDIVKLDKPCYVKFIVGTGYRNVRRHDWSDGDPGEVVVDSTALGGDIFSYVTIGEDLHECYTDGSLRVNAGNMVVYTNAEYPDPSYTYKVNVYVRDDGWRPIYDYAVHYNWDVFHCSFCCIQFTDESHDTYTLSVLTNGWKRVNYNSDAPTITRVRMLGP